MRVPNKIYENVSVLRPLQKAMLIDELIPSLDKSNKEIDKLWAQEAEDRIDAYESGKLKSVALSGHTT